MKVLPFSSTEAADICKRRHYLRRRPAVSFAFCLTDADVLGKVYGVATFGAPASRHLMLSACRTDPNCVIELNRLWVSDEMPRNTESWFLARALRQMPPRIVVSYADTSVGHVGYVYRAANFHYAGLTDADRKTPRLDYVTPGKHSRDTTRNGTIQSCEKRRRRPKHRYWTTTGDRRQRKQLERLATWPKMQWETPTDGNMEGFTR